MPRKLGQSPERSKVQPRSNSRFAFCILHFAFCILLFARAAAGEPAKAPAERAPREIYVPYSDLHVLLEQGPQRVLLEREQYEELVRKAKKTPEDRAPLPAAILSADYDVTLEPQRALLCGTLAVEVLEDGLHALPLDLGGVGLREVWLDGRAAAVGQEKSDRAVLFVEGVGRHALKLEMVAPVETTAARQTLHFRLPRPPAATMRLSAPGDVEIKSGLSVISRAVDPAAKQTRFELLPVAGDVALAMTLNSHLQRQERAVAARGVVIDALTEGHERLDATLSMEVLHRAVDRFQFAVPEELEIVEVDSPLLARWNVQTEGGRKRLDVALREPTVETVVLRVAAVRALKTPGDLGAWQAPRLDPLDVVGCATVFGLLLDERLKAESFNAEGLISIDAAVLADALPAKLSEERSAGRGFRAVAAWYAPQADYALAARFVEPPAEMAATTSLLLVLSDRGQEVLGGVSLLPLVEKRFAFDLSVPDGWKVVGVTAPDGKPLAFEAHGARPPLADGARPPSAVTGDPAQPGAAVLQGSAVLHNSSRIRINVADGMPPGEEFKVNFRAVREPKGWLSDWTSMPVDFPAFAVAEATRQEGAIAVETRDDMKVLPESVQGLAPLDAADMAQYGLADARAALAYRHDSPRYAAALMVERTRPRLTARTFSFFRVEPDSLACHYELAYAVEEARVERLAFLLPKDTPVAVSIAGLDGVKLKEQSFEEVAQGRRWNVLLAEARRGRIRLAVDFQQPLPAGEPKDYPLPAIAADGVAHQSGLLAVEGCAELDVRVNMARSPSAVKNDGARPPSAVSDDPAQPGAAVPQVKPVDIGELAEADYRPGRRLLGAFAHGDVRPNIRIDVVRHPAYALIPSIVEQCEMDTRLSTDGRGLSQARFRLRTKAVFLQVQLPAGAVLWSAELDGVALKPQRQDDRVLVDLPAGTDGAAQTLQIVYEAPAAKLGWRGTVETPAPKLLLRAEGRPEVVEVPLADLRWRVHPPAGYEAVRVGGTLAAVDLKRPEPAAAVVAGVLYRLTGGFSGTPIWAPLREYARESARRYEKDAASEVLHEEPPSSSKDSYVQWMDPRFYPSDSQSDEWSELPRPSEGEKRIRAALQSPTQLVFNETPLHEAVDYLKKYHHIEIQLDRKSLDDLGITGDTPITVNLKGLSLRSALRLILKEHGLTYVIEDEVLLITTPEEAENRLATKVYPVADLVLPPHASKETQADFDSLINAIKSTIRPQSWDETGGVGSIEPFENNLSLTVSQTQEVHEEISDFLKQQRTLKREQAKRGMPVWKPSTPEQRMARQAGRGPRGGMMGAMGGGMGGGMGMGGMGFGGGMPEAAAEEKSGEAAAKEDRIKLGAGVNSDAGAAGTITVAEEEAAYKEKLAAKAGVEEAARKRAKPQSLAGTRSLKIDLLQGDGNLEGQSASGSAAVFQSLGVEPKLAVTLVDRRRIDAAAWGLALLVGLWGVALTRRSVRAKAAFVLVVCLAASVAPPLTDGIEVARLGNMAFYAAALLVPYYLAAGMFRFLLRLGRRFAAWCAKKCRARTAAVGATALLSALILIANAHAAPNAKPQAASGAKAQAVGAVESSDGKYVIQVVEPPKPVAAPDDAILLPYDPESTNIVKFADKMLVPYERYVELWNRAYPDKKIETKTPPAPYALAGAAYKTTLEGDEYLLVVGRMEIDVFAEDFVEIPLALAGGARGRAVLAGKPARLKAVVQSQPVAQQAAKTPASDAGEPTLAVLYVSGKGRHVLELDMRLKLSRQGGWRVAEGRLPAAPASALSITAPLPQTEVRLGRLPDRRAYETRQANETIETALGPDGTLGIQWRPQVAEGRVDHALTAESNVALDVQEDGLRLDWRIAFEFPRGRRERFEVDLPVGFLLEKVEGANVRGWEIRKTTRGQSAEIELLQEAKDREAFCLRLRRAGRAGQGDWKQFDVPTVAVPDAALHNGQLTIRRSPLLELQTLDHSGATRTDWPQDAEKTPAERTGPLGLRPFEAYRFAAVPFAVRLAVAPISTRLSAEVQTVLKIGAYKRNLESRIAFDAQDRPVHRLRLLLPETLRLDRVTVPGDYQYAVSRENGRPLLTIHLAAGRLGETPVVILGRLGREGEIAELPLPRIEALDVERQQGDVAVQVDPAFDVDAAELQHCETVLLGRLHAWLNPNQRDAARLGLHYARADYAGTLRLSPRKPDVVCDAISNVRVTDRAIEETILLDFTIRNAGVREVSFLLPCWMAGCRISAPMLRRKTVELIGKDGNGMNSVLRARIELQDEVMGQLRILVENDRRLSPGSHEVPIPTVETGRTNRRFAIIENAGRDEVAVEEDRLRDVEVLGRRQRDWDYLKSLLGREMTLAYLASSDAEQPRLSFRTEARAAVATVAARIGLAETALSLDAFGAYRAETVLHVDNATEQFLEIRLPEGAELWTARVAGEPVKPVVMPDAAKKGGAWIPLLKTAPGDLSFEVSLKYGGRMPPLRPLANLGEPVAFPLLRCVNIRPEQSQVRLYLPEEYCWFDFGGTMRRVGDEADLQAGYLKYQTSQTAQLLSTLRHGDTFAKVRAAENVKRQLGFVQAAQSALDSSDRNAALQSELAANARISRQAEQEAENLDASILKTETQSNSERLSAYFADQKRNLARNVVNESGVNFLVAPEARDRRSKVQRDAPRQPSANAFQIAVSQKPRTRGEESANVPADAAQSAALGRKLQESDSIERYQQQLRQQSVEQRAEMHYDDSQSFREGAEQPAKPGSKPDPFAVSSEPGRPSDASLPQEAPASPSPGALAPARSVPTQSASPAAGLASLDFQLPKRGRLFHFTSPQGEAVVTARTVSGDLLRRAIEIAVAVAAAGFLWLLIRTVRRGGFLWLTGRAGSRALICLGLLLICGGVFPGLGLAVVVVGLGATVHRISEKKVQ